MIRVPTKQMNCLWLFRPTQFQIHGQWLRRRKMWPHLRSASTLNSRHQC